MNTPNFTLCKVREKTNYYKINIFDGFVFVLLILYVASIYKILFSFFLSVETSSSLSSSRHLQLQLLSWRLDHSRIRFPSEPWKVLFAFLWSCSCLTVTGFVTTIAHDRYPVNASALPDLLLDNLPRHAWAFQASEWCFMGKP